MDIGRIQSLTTSTAGVECACWIDREGLERAHNGVRRDVVVEVREPEMSEQQNHQQGIGGCHL